MAGLTLIEQDEVGYSFLLITYLVCSDEQIHIEESRRLHALVEELNLNGPTTREMEKILLREEDRIALESVIRSVPKQEREKTLRLLLDMAYADGFCDPLERQLLREVARKWRVPFKKLDQLCAKAEQTAQQRERNSKPEKRDSEILLAGPEYYQAIERCTRVAREDIVFAEKAMESAQKMVKQLKKDLASIITRIEKGAMRGGVDSAKEVVKRLREDQEIFDREIFRNFEQVQESLYKKRRALNYFTLSFLGKTKAGKSTLHAVIAGEGWNAIGNGKQRTTRYNRIYEWEGIRIIDTPGFGAPGGKTDEEIAKSIIDESDVICFVLTNNFIAETEFQFLRLLKEKAKPLLILLNVQENLEHSVHLRRFLKNPDKLFSEDKNDLGGHIDRIRHYAQQFYGNDYFTMVPVQLLAARLSRQDGHAEHKEALYRASRLQDFLDAVRASMIHDGVIHRSQTLLGCTVADIQQPSQWIGNQAEGYLKLAKELENRRDGALKRIKSVGQDVLRELETQLRNVFKDLRESVEKFSEDHWEDGKDALNRAWETHMNRKEVESRVVGAYKESAETYSANIREILEEIGKEMKLVAQLEGFSFDLPEQDSSMFLKSIFKWGGTLLTIAAAVSPFLPGINIAVVIGESIAAAVFALLSRLFSSKDKKRRKSVANISSELRKQLEEQERKVVEKYLEDFRKQQSDLYESVRVYFKKLVQGLHGIGSEMKEAHERLAQVIDSLNRAYAKRVLDWSEGRLELLTNEGIDATIEAVEREIGKSMRIKTRHPVSLKKSQQNLQDVLQENVQFILSRPGRRVHSTKERRIDDRLPGSSHRSQVRRTTKGIRNHP